MTNNIALELLILLCLTLANGFFAASEIAIVSARKSRLEQQAQAGQRGAAAALALAENPSRFLSTVQVGITLISTCAAVFGGAGLSGALEGMLAGIPILAPYARSLALALVVLLVSYLSLIVGELVPKRLALQSAEAVSSAVAPFMGLVSRAVSPAVGFLTLSTELVLRVLGRHNVAETPITACMKSGMKRIAPNIPMPVMKREMNETLISRLRKSHSGRIGSAARDSATRKARSITTAPANRPRTRVEVQP